MFSQGEFTYKDTWSDRNIFYSNKKIQLEETFLPSLGMR